MASERVVFDSGYLIEAADPTREEWKIDAMYAIDAASHGDLQIVGPYLLTTELAAVCLRKVKSKVIKESGAVRLFDLLDIVILNVDVQRLTPIGLYEFAKSINCQVYDSVYLMLAKLHGLPIASRDGGMLAGAKSLKIPVWTPPAK